MRLRSGVILGASTSVLLLAILVLANALWQLPLAPFDVFEWVTRIAPGAAITWGIDLMVSVLDKLGINSTSAAAKLTEQASAVMLFVGTFAALGAVVARFASTSRRRAVIAGIGAGAVWLVFETLALAMHGRLSIGRFAWVAIVLLGGGALLGRLVWRGGDVEREPAPARRRFLIAAVGGMTALSALLLGFAGLFRRSVRTSVPGGTRIAVDSTTTSGPAASPSATTLAQRLAAVRGTRRELTPNGSFYRIDINLSPPKLDGETWRLGIDGLVDHPLSLSLAELRDLPAVSQAATLECISNPVGGDLIGTSLWTGVRLMDVLERAGLQAGARAIHMRAADGFYESVGRSDFEDPRTLLVYEMNHEPLADIHGFPLRISIPNRHGMKQPKWITKLHAADHDGPGYWVDRGWSATAIPHTTSVIDTVGKPMLHGETRIVPVGGIAYAGARGISKVEVQVDDGPWMAAQLIAPPLSPLCWVLWRYEWLWREGRHTFRVRAYDGRGVLQDTQEAPTHPDGATGIHSLTTTV